MSKLETLRSTRAQLDARRVAMLATVDQRGDGSFLPSEVAEARDLRAQLDELDASIAETTDDELRENRAAAARRDLSAGARSDGTDTRLGEWFGRELRGLTGSGVTGGGAFTPNGYSPFFWDRLAAASVLLKSGARVVMTNNDALLIPRWTADTTTGWTAEAATISSTDATADIITAVPRKLAALQALSTESIDDSSPHLLEVVAQGMVRSVALKYDLGAFEGSGTAPEVRGLKNVAGITTQSLGTNGLAIANLDPFADAIGTLEGYNAEATAIVMHPRTWQGLLKLREATGSNKPMLQDSAGAGTQGVERSIYGVPVHLSSQLSTAETQGSSTAASSVYVYQADEVVAVMRNDVQVLVDRSRLFNSDQCEVRAVMRADIVVPNPTAIVRISGAL